ncbi:hypothetical protein MNKW57_20640 [Biformimicrobium ophioploci]|uniref:Carrier domain-containing protein n=1 Tax=Biformimicrobium ophioploci TaxID=3036711 RepID=A0ABQ6M098_9GAMM|nr:hypothetical protein MNKW57_20640 [Microbulbifer sp. NKW57]
MLDNSDRKLLYTYGTGKQVVRQFSPYINVISAHAEAQPQRIAVSCEGQSLTYGALWTCSGALAGALSRLGIGRGSRVALYMPPSLDIPIAILALHRLGAVYVPIDPEFPKGRVEAILEAVAPELVLTRGTLHSIPESYLGLSRELCDIEATPDNLESLEIHPSDESHIFFTSGTTGRPKGIVATHENLAHYIWSAIHEYRFSSSDRFIAAARYTFSISLFELLVPLVSGGSVNILPRNRVLDLAYLASAVESATVFHFGPGLLKVFLPYICRNFGDTNRFSGVRHASSGGDMIPPEILEKLKYCFREADVYVIYGASEISCMGCTYEVPKERVVQQTRVGRPFENTSIRVLDQDGKSVLPGVVGTIHFSGPGLVKGYLDNPALTAERFYSHEGKRWYSIGDIGRIDEQGNLQLLGREDFQINVCGMRVETLEIESLLKKHKVVSDCVVHGRRDSEDSETTIVAYVVPRSGGEVKKADLNGYLSDLLPEYMLPHAYVAMEKLPLNHNGKLDRGQLPVPCAEDSSLPECNFDLTPTQLTLVRIWEGLLCTKGIGIEHNFFKLGGDSIRAVNLLAQIDKEFRVAIPIASLVGHATIKDLAAIIDGEVRLPEVNNVVVLKDGDNRKPPLFCLCGVLTYKDLAESLDIDNMVCAISEDLAGLDLSAEVESAMRSGSRRQLLDSIINHYLQVIRQYQARGPYYLCGLSLGGFIAMEVARKMEAMGEQVCLLAMFDTWSPGFLDRLTTRQRISAHFRKLLREGPAYVYRRILARFKRVITRGFFAKPEAERPGGAYLGMIGRRLIIDDYPLRPIDRKILFFRAEERADFEPQNMPDLGWSEYASDLDITAISGDHYGIMKSGQVEAIAKIMSERIRASETANAASTVLAG